MVRKETAIIREKMGGNGIGKAYQYNIVSKEDLHGHGRMFAKIVLPPGTTISWHTHVGDRSPTTSFRAWAISPTTTARCTK